MPNVLIVPGDGFKQVESMFKSEGWDIVYDMNEADLVQFVGGADVSPSLYGQRTHPTTQPNAGRDDREVVLYNQALALGIPMAGICRGGQFLNVMNGGSMHQHVDNHDRGSHLAYLTGASLPITVTSTHHQMMEPNWEDATVLMSAKESTFKRRMSNLDSATNVEYVINMNSSSATYGDVEAVYYEGTHSLCFQAHPEYSGAKDTKEVYFIFLENYCFGALEAQLQSAKA